MLYRDHKLGQPGIWAALKAQMAWWGRGRQRIADLDLLAASDHLRRDVGVESPVEPARFNDVLWRK